MGFQQPDKFIEHLHNSEEVTMWHTIPGHGIFSSCFLEGEYGTPVTINLNG